MVLQGGKRRVSLRSQYLRRNAFWIDDLFKHVNHVKELAVDVADDNHGLLDAQHILLVLYKHAPLTSVFCDPALVAIGARTKPVPF